MKIESNEPKIVVIGGGRGTSTVLQGLKNHTSALTAIVTMFDSGGSSGLLQKELGYLPLGDLRQCLWSLSKEDEFAGPMRELIDFRFRGDTSLNGHSLGNLLLAALTTLGEDLERAIDEMARLLQITGRVVPVALERADLCAELSDGRTLRGETNIDLRGEHSPKIERIFLAPSVSANPRAVDAIFEADVVVLGPGDLYTSIIPNLLAAGIPQALATTHATRIYVCNLMTKLGETDGFKASDFVREMLRYIGGPHLDWAVISTNVFSAPMLEAYRREAAEQVEFDLEEVQTYLPGVFATALGDEQQTAKHDVDRIAETILSIFRFGRARQVLIDHNPRRGTAPTQ